MGLWGFHDAHPIHDGLRFSVNGYLQLGKVEVIYCEGADLFVVNTLNPDGSINQHVDGVYLDCLANVIDEMVETI